MNWPHWPITPQERDAFRAFVGTMRELGVVSAFGIALGPAPTRAQELAAAVRDAADEAKPALEQELAEELRKARMAELLAEYRDKLAATGRDYTDEELVRIIPEARLHEIAARDA